MVEEHISLLDHVKALLGEMDLRYQQRFEAQTSAINAALQAAKEAVTKAEIATEKRFAGVNEFRQTLSDQASTFVNRAEFTALKERMDRNEGRSSGAGTVLQALPVILGVVIAAAGLVVGLIF
jgi:hypothetical protein